MFCHKCGQKSIDGAAFCQKCGAKMIKDQSEAQILAEPVIVSPETATPLMEPRNISTAEPVQQASAAPVPTGIQEAYGRLNESAKRCPKIKKIAVSKGAKGTSDSFLIIHGLFNKYTYIPSASSEKTSISWSLKWVLYLVYALILLCDALFLQFFFQEKYFTELTIFCLIGCVIWFPFLFFSNKERKEIIAHVNETFDCQISPPSKVPLVVSYVLNLIQIVLCIAAFVLGFGGSSDVPATASNNPMSHTVENVSLSQTYANEDEGFLFMYPDDWTIREDSMMAAVLAPADSGYSASITIMKSGADETYFTATMLDLETMYSLTKDNFKMINLSDVTINGHSARKLIYSYNDSRGSYSQIQYFYIVNNDMYFVTCSSLENHFDKYAPVFDAIMDSYTIIAANTSGESRVSTATDFVGTYSCDASFQDPTGKWNNFYYLLEIGLDGSALVVTQTWRGNYLFDHARVSPSDVTGNTLVFDASIVGSTEPEIHSLTYLPAEDSPLGKDTIYIDDDETMPFVRE